MASQPKVVLLGGVRSSVLFVTGTDTGVGKTVFSVLLARQLRAQGARVAALKPICSGGRNDARALRSAAGEVLSLEEVNPWHFKAAKAPVLAAREEGKRVQLAQVKEHVRKFLRHFETILVEGAGGLLSPLGENFDSRDLIVALRGRPLIVCPNRLGAVNQTRLVLDALPPWAKQQAQVILMSPQKPGGSFADNQRLLGEFFPKERIHLIPWLATWKNFSAKLDIKITRTLNKIASAQPGD